MYKHGGCQSGTTVPKQMTKENLGVAKLQLCFMMQLTLKSI